MPLITKVGRKSLRAKLALAVVYALLIIGATTTLYPFLMMGAIGLTGPSDQNANRLIPLYLTDDQALFDKYRDDKYGGDQIRMKSYTLGVATTLKGMRPDPDELAFWEMTLMELPPTQWLAGFRTRSGQVSSRLSSQWQRFLKVKYGTLEKVNQTYNELNPAFPRIQAPAELLDRPGWNPKAGVKWNDWIEFKKSLPSEFRVPITGTWMWQEFLRTKHRNQISAVPAQLAGGASLIEEIPLATIELADEELKAEFIKSWRLKSLDDLLEFKHGYSLPLAAFEANHLAKNKREIRREFATRNYSYVFDFIALNGRALWNTFLFCALAVLTQLIVNPLCAYALSRHSLPITSNILLFLLAAMAFPAEVAMIPSFLLLKDLGILNTFAALVLPTAASGFMIFLLKGFFDSLPKEIFESAQIDGATDWLLLLKMALPLCRPVLGYLALLAFMGAYGSFLFAFLVAQKQEMWTLMVFIFQMQGYAPKAVMMAALTLAAVPTLFVFLAAQRTIMKGIILPSER